MADPTPDPSTDSPTEATPPADAPRDAGQPQAPAASAASIAEQSLEEVEKAAEAIRSSAGASEAGQMPADGPHGVPLPDFAHAGAAAASSNGQAGLGLLDDINLTVTVELGRTRMYVEDVLRLNADAVVELDKAAGDPVDIYVNDRHVARGEVLVLNENFCVRISEIIKQPEMEE